MSDTTFVANQTHIVSTWLNDVNDAVYHAIGTGVGGVAPTTPADVRTNLLLPSTLVGEGASLIGNNTSGGSLGANVQAALDLKANITSLVQVTHQTNNWDDALTPNNADQFLLYTISGTTASVDHRGWAAVIHNQGTSTDNLVPLVGVSYHDALFNNLTGGCWGIATEAWSNATNYTTLIGGELSVISQTPNMANPSVGMNSVFKNRADGVASPALGGTLFNFNSSAVLITSQARPLSGNTTAGSGWQAAIRIGDVGFGSGLDWEGGSQYPGSSVYKAYSTVVDMTNALQDLAGGYPWFALYKNSLTYWGMRFDGVLSGSLDTNNVKVNAGGAGYAVADQGNITGGGGSGAKYQVATVAAGVVTSVNILSLNRGSGYGTTVGAATAATSGGGAGLTLDIAPANGYTWGADISISAGGAGYAVNDVSTINTGTAGVVPLAVKITNVAAGVVTAIQLITSESFGSTGVRASQGSGYTTGAKATTALIGTGAGLQIAINKVYVDTSIGGEKWEFWRMSNPSNPSSSGSRDSYIDAGFPPVSRSIGLALNDSYSTAIIQAITSSTSPTVSTIGSAATHHWAMASTDAAWNAAAVGAYAGKIAVLIDGGTKYIPVYA